jgi:pilus assembly protein Flp/PilA
VARVLVWSFRGVSPELTFFEIGGDLMSRVLGNVTRVVREEEGASLAEYGLLLALIAIACIVSIVALGSSVSTMFSNVAASI